MTTQKKKPRVGDECWEVEWCTFMFVEDDGVTCNPDLNKYAIRNFLTRDEAITFAAKKWPDSCDGLVTITPKRFTPYDEADSVLYPHAGFWEHTDDSEIIDDESGEPHK